MSVRVADREESFSYTDILELRLMQYMEIRWIFFRHHPPSLLTYVNNTLFIPNQIMNDISLITKRIGLQQINLRRASARPPSWDQSDGRGDWFCKTCQAKTKSALSLSVIFIIDFKLFRWRFVSLLSNR